MSRQGKGNKTEKKPFPADNMRETTVWEKGESLAACHGPCSRGGGPPIWGSQDNSGGKGPQEVTGTASCSKQGKLWGQTRLLRALFSWVLNISKDGACMASPSNLFYCLTVLIAEKHFFISLWTAVLPSPKLGESVFCCLLEIIGRTGPISYSALLVMGTQGEYHPFTTTLWVC